MILLWTLLGVVLAAGIARYNESNKLFWILFTSFMVGIAGGSVYAKLNANVNDDSKITSSIMSTQGLSTSCVEFSTVTEDATNAPIVFNTKPCELDTTIEHRNCSISKCCAEMRTPPPRTSNATLSCTDSLTHLDVKYPL